MALNKLNVGLVKFNYNIHDDDINQQCRELGKKAIHDSRIHNFSVFGQSY